MPRKPTNLRALGMDLGQIELVRRWVDEQIAAGPPARLASRLEGARARLDAEYQTRWLRLLDWGAEHADALGTGDRCYAAAMMRRARGEPMPPRV